MARQSPYLRLADTLLGGRLKEFIESSRGDGRSWDWIARELWATTNQEIDATGPTVQDWGRQLGIDSSEKAAS